jgi:hypothetical protein
MGDPSYSVGLGNSPDQSCEGENSHSISAMWEITCYCLEFSSQLYLSCQKPVGMENNNVPGPGKSLVSIAMHLNPSTNNK